MESSPWPHPGYLLLLSRFGVTGWCWALCKHFLYIFIYMITFILTITWRLGHYLTPFSGEETEAQGDKSLAQVHIMRLKPRFICFKASISHIYRQTDTHTHRRSFTQPHMLLLPTLPYTAVVSKA